MRLTTSAPRMNTAVVVVRDRRKRHIRPGSRGSIRATRRVSSPRPPRRDDKRHVSAGASGSRDGGGHAGRRSAPGRALRIGFGDLVGAIRVGQESEGLPQGVETIDADYDDSGSQPTGSMLRAKNAASSTVAENGNTCATY